MSIFVRTASKTMKKLIAIITTLLLAATFCQAQKLTDSGYRTVGYIKADGTIQNSSYRTVGYIKSDGRVQDASYRTIGHARDIPKEWAALYFFFKL